MKVYNFEPSFSNLGRCISSLVRQSRNHHPKALDEIHPTKVFGHSYHPHEHRLRNQLLIEVVRWYFEESCNTRHIRIQGHIEWLLLSGYWWFRLLGGFRRSHEYLTPVLSYSHRPSMNPLLALDFLCETKNHSSITISALLPLSPSTATTSFRLTSPI